MNPLVFADSLAIARGTSCAHRSSVLTGLEALELLTQDAAFMRRTGAAQVELLRPVPGGVVEVRATLAAAHDEEWLVLGAVIEREDCWLCREALDYNATLALGAIALIDGDFVVRHALRLARALAADLSDAIDVVAQEAASLCVRLRSPRVDRDLFSTFAD